MSSTWAVGAGAARFRLDPRTKILLLIMVNGIMVGGGTEGLALAVRPLVGLVPFLLLLAEGRRSLAWTYLALFAPALLVEAYLVPLTEGIANFLAIVVSALFARMLPSLAMGYYAVTTTTVSEFVASMERLHVPRSVIIPLSVMFRFFPTVLAEERAISDSMRMRGIAGGSAWRNPVAMLEHRAVPLMICVVKIGEELSAAALTRGLGNPVKRTNICEIGFRWQDAAFAGVAVMASCLMIW